MVALPILTPCTQTDAEYKLDEKPAISTVPLQFWTSNVTLLKSIESTSSLSGPIPIDLPPSNVIFLTLFGIFTVTLHFTLTPDPSLAAALISTVPFVSAVTVPLLLTEAILASELVQVTLLSAALSGLTVAVSVSV